jgi:histidine phosphotransferase ChpT
MTDTTGEPSASGAGGETDLAALVASRICHDIVSPVGAMRYALELLPAAASESPEGRLMRDAVETALGRIEFFRMAFGDPGSGGEVSAKAMREMLAAAYADSRSTVSWEDDEERPRGDMRIACLGLACVDTATPRGAQITVSRDGVGWAISAEAPRLKIDAPLWNALGEGRVPDELHGAQVQFGLLAMASRTLRRPISLTVEEAGLILRV